MIGAGKEPRVHRPVEDGQSPSSSTQGQVNLSRMAHIRNKRGGAIKVIDDLQVKLHDQILDEFPYRICSCGSWTPPRTMPIAIHAHNHPGAPAFRPADGAVKVFKSVPSGVPNVSKEGQNRPLMA